MTPYGAVAETPIGSWGHLLLQGAFRCDECEFMSLAVARVDADLRRYSEAVELLTRDPVWMPAMGVGREFPDVPEDISAAAGEAYQCLSISALRAAVLLARSVIEATAKAKGFTTGQLFHKIEALHEAKLVREHVKDAAHEVRHLGNDMAHGDFVDSVTSEEAEEVLQLMSEVLDEVFQSPARVQRRRAARQAKHLLPAGDGEPPA